MLVGKALRLYSPKLSCFALIRLQTFQVFTLGNVSLGANNSSLAAVIVFSTLCDTLVTLQHTRVPTKGGLSNKSEPHSNLFATFDSSFSNL
ncbi:Hypothetical protein NTJ_01729 [Nesidiocoris tenuis]|uniref:Uncharacterized protein n=1 Tax=Nesidiocoris tenuis TaxID=355587 RepID=A0ABN7ACF3_9HEMI|nr:Hypothetical protein NTJ_01729 [Nesidiocoris tenuis]